MQLAKCFKKYLLLSIAMLFVLQIVAAEEVVLTIKNTIGTLDGEHEKPLKDLLEAMGHKVTLVDKNSVDSINFSKFALIVIAGESGFNEQLKFTEDLPVNKHKTVSLYTPHLDEWDWVEDQAVGALNYNNQEAVYNDQGYLIVNTIDPKAALHNQVGKKINFVEETETPLTSLAFFSDFEGSEFLLVGDKGLEILNKTQLQERVGFFGVPSPSTWTKDTNLIFQNFVNWTLYGKDGDGDGWRDDEDNCPNTPNPKQEDVNKNGIGDVCDNTPPVVELLAPKNGTVIQSPNGFEFIDFFFKVTDDISPTLECSLFSTKFNSFGNPNKDFIKFGSTVTVASGTNSSIFPGAFTDDTDTLIWNIICDDGSLSAFAPDNFTFTVILNSGCKTNEDCTDNVFCNGEEICSAGTCSSGTPLVCNDNNTKTIDFCSEEKKACMFEACSTVEICDGKDNNCNGLIDEGFPDTDNDAIADCVDPDIDGDGILNAVDFIIGNESTLQTNRNDIRFKVNNQRNPKNFNGKTSVEFMRNATTIVSFNFSFKNDSMFDMRSMTLLVNSNDRGSLVIGGITLPDNDTKTAFIDNVDRANDVLCIIDSEVSQLEVVGDCTNGVKLTCDTTGNLTTAGPYTCTKVENGTMYKITGLKHSAITEHVTPAPDSGGSSSSGGNSGRSGGNARTRGDRDSVSLTTFSNRERVSLSQPTQPSTASKTVPTNAPPPEVENEGAEQEQRGFLSITSAAITGLATRNALNAVLIAVALGLMGYASLNFFRSKRRLV